jgi:hypothetical protein
MAPKIFDGSDYGFPVDVYAFRLLVYPCMTSLVPWQGLTSAFAMGVKMCAGQRPLIAPSVGTNWRELITACWSGFPTFTQTATGIGSVEFLDQTIDRHILLPPERSRCFYGEA